MMPDSKRKWLPRIGESGNWQTGLAQPGVDYYFTLVENIFEQVASGHPRSVRLGAREYVHEEADEAH